MKYELTPIEKRIKIARTWAKRVEKLVENGMSEQAFCRKHKFHASFFNRNKNLRVIPSQRTVNRFEKALKEEGV